MRVDRIPPCSAGASGPLCLWTSLAPWPLESPNLLWVPSHRGVPPAAEAPLDRRCQGGLGTRRRSLALTASPIYQQQATDKERQNWCVVPLRAHAQDLSGRRCELRSEEISPLRKCWRAHAAAPERFEEAGVCCTQRTKQLHGRR